VDSLHFQNAFGRLKVRSAGRSPLASPHQNLVDE
jgi:hypothetical protein